METGGLVGAQQQQQQQQQWRLASSKEYGARRPPVPARPSADGRDACETVGGRAATVLGADRGAVPSAARQLFQGGEPARRPPPPPPQQQQHSSGGQHPQQQPSLFQFVTGPPLAHGQQHAQQPQGGGGARHRPDAVPAGAGPFQAAAGWGAAGHGSCAVHAADPYCAATAAIQQHLLALPPGTSAGAHAGGSQYPYQGGQCTLWQQHVQHQQLLLHQWAAGATAGGGVLQPLEQAQRCAGQAAYVGARQGPKGRARGRLRPNPRRSLCDMFDLAATLQDRWAVRGRRA